MTQISRLAAVLVLLALPAMGGTGVTFAGLKTDPKAPVSVSADQLTVNQADGSATFSGHVVVTQSDLVLQAETVVVIYNKDGKDIAQLKATGGVSIKAGENAATAETALYTVTTAELLLQGKVLLSEPRATLAGETLKVDLRTGLGTMEGRVTTTIAPGGN